MTVTQISIFVENRPGRLAAVTRVLGEADVDIQALSIADTSEFGVLRLIVNATDLAAQVLRDAGFRVERDMNPAQITDTYFAPYNRRNPDHSIFAAENVNYCLAIRDSEKNES